MVATRSKKGKDAVAVQVPPWSYVDEESARDRLIDPVTKNSQPAVMNIIFLLCGAYSLYFLVANVLIPLAGNGSPSPSPHWVVIAAAAGCFASCMYAVYPVLLPNPSYTPPGHGPFARVGAESRLESLQRLLIIVRPSVRGAAQLIVFAMACTLPCLFGVLFFFLPPPSPPNVLIGTILIPLSSEQYHYHQQQQHQRRYRLISLL